MQNTWLYLIKEAEEPGDKPSQAGGHLFIIIFVSNSVSFINGELKSRLN